jgi:uncharacterized RDD family membrane protein YckC
MSPPPPHRAAGIVTRVAAAAVDLVVVLVMMVGLLLAVAGVRFLRSPLSFRWPAPSWHVSVVAGAVLAAVYLAAAWATTGRTYGAAVLGLRVLSARGGRLGWVRAGVRAVLYLLFPVGLLWAAVSKRRRSVQDAVLWTVVVYDWDDDAGMRPPQAPAAGRLPGSDREGARP